MVAKEIDVPSSVVSYFVDSFHRVEMAPVAGQNDGKERRRGTIESKQRESR